MFSFGIFFAPYRHFGQKQPGHGQSMAGPWLGHVSTMAMARPRLSLPFHVRLSHSHGEAPFYSHSVVITFRMGYILLDVSSPFDDGGHAGVEGLQGAAARAVATFFQ